MSLVDLYSAADPHKTSDLSLCVSGPVHGWPAADPDLTQTQKYGPQVYRNFDVLKSLLWEPLYSIWTTSNFLPDIFVSGALIYLWQWSGGGTSVSGRASLNRVLFLFEEISQPLPSRLGEVSHYRMLHLGTAKMAEKILAFPIPPS